jgi:hypothetical protein
LDEVLEYLGFPYKAHQKTKVVTAKVTELLSQTAAG